jgi:hypothetical protein
LVSWNSAALRPESLTLVMVRVAPLVLALVMVMFCWSVEALIADEVKDSEVEERPIVG